MELNKKREAEVNKLRKDVEEANIQQESILSNLKRKQGDATAEMTEQIDALGKMKSKIEKDKGRIMNETADARAARVILILMKVGILTSTWFQNVPFCSLISEQFLFSFYDHSFRCP